MDVHGLHPERALPRDVVAPFFYSAPLALVAAGVVLLVTGGLALTSHWAGLTLSVTHLGTLGLITMVAAGLLLLLLPWVGAGEGARLPLAHAIYYALVVGVVGLCWGTARGHIPSVFVAVGAMGVTGVLLLVHGVRALRRGGARGPTWRALRLALLGFFLVASLGIWLGHGHGGMKFPGPRSLWLQVHLCIGLSGWLGAIWMAVTWRVLPALEDVPPVSPGLIAALHWSVGLGITLPSLLLLADYFGLLGAGAWSREGVAALLGLPALAAVWLVHPWAVWRGLRAASAGPARELWRSVLSLGPAVFAAAALAWLADDPRWPLLFGWLAIVGWGGLMVHGLLVRVVPFLLVPVHPATRSGFEFEPWTTPRVPERRWRVVWQLHVLVLALGAGAIYAGDDGLVRMVGAMLAVLGILLLRLHAHAMRRPETPPLPATGSSP